MVMTDGVICYLKIREINHYLRGFNSQIIESGNFPIRKRSWTQQKHYMNIF